jgi:putative phage-type endonuclease
VPCVGHWAYRGRLGGAVGGECGEVTFEVHTYASVTEWAKRRADGIGGSEAAAVWGVSPYSSPRALWEQKVNGVEIEIDPELAQWGHEIEPAIANFYGWKTGREVVDAGSNTIYQSKQWPWMRVSLDRVIDGCELLECKNRGGYGARNWREEADGATPLDVVLQVQHGLAVTGWRKGIVGVALGGLPPTFTEIWRDDELIELHVEKCRAFWQSVMDRKAPAVDGHDATREALRRRFRSESGKVRQLDDKALYWHKRVKRLSALHDKIGDLKAEYENRLRDAVGDAEVGILPGDAGRYCNTLTKASEKRKSTPRFMWRK